MVGSPAADIKTKFRGLQSDPFEREGAKGATGGGNMRQPGVQTGEGMFLAFGKKRVNSQTDIARFGIRVYDDSIELSYDKFTN